ncbi:MAG: SGNH/GDSL hydrolase family protein [Planctomycetaceae bacterium]
MKRLRLGVSCCLALLMLETVSVGADFALQDGDTVVFLGDSITAARTYGKFIENYTLLRYPQRKVRFINAGFGGDTADGGLKRLERDVFAHKATVLTVAFGMNDIGWGVYADEEHKRKYLDAVRGIVTKCRERGVRVYLCSAAVTGADPAKSEDSFLQKMCDEGMALSKSLGGEAIDVQRSMREIQKRVWAWNEKLREANKIKDEAKLDSLHAADGVHLNDLGQLAMAFAILKGLGAPAEVSSAKLDFAEGKLLDADGCDVTNIRREDSRLEFTRLDVGLPFNHGIFFALHYRFVPVPNELNRYLLSVKNLPAGKYDVTADDRAVGSFTAAQLGEGVNIASTTANAWQPGGPWNAQADALVHLTNARSELDVANLLGRLHLSGSPLIGELATATRPTNERLEELQRLVAKPRPFRFVIQPVK